MKDKKGFTLVELLAVIAILTVLVIIALPNVLKMFRNAKQNTFATEVQNLIKSAEDKYVTGSILSGNNTCFDSRTNPLDMSGRDNISYLIRLTDKGKVTEVTVIDDEYQLIINNSNGINKADIGSSYKVEARNKTTDILDCNNSFLVQGEEGTGDESAPYKIQYIEDLVELSNNVEKGETYAGKTIVLSRNLDFKNKDSYKDSETTKYKDINGNGQDEPLMTELTTGSGFKPLKLFSGTFDGRNYRIDNLYINKTEERSGSVAVISNLINGSVKNLTVQGTIETNATFNPLGGIVGKIENSTIDNCVNEVTVTNKTNTYAVGGVAGWSSGSTTIKNSTNKANISGGGYTAGIIAGNQGGTLTIENCKNYGTITNELGTVSAGLVGQEIDNAKKTIIKDSINYGEIIGKTTTGTILYLGGLVGKNSVELEISNSNNEGKITINANNGFFVGGLIGEARGKANINNCHNKNSITSNSGDAGRRIGGLVGIFTSTQTSTITNSSNEKEGVLIGGNRTGGIAGESAAGLVMNNCYNLANISTNNDAWSGGINVGGLFGDTSGFYDMKHEDVVILNSYNKGNLEVNTNNYGCLVGGLIGGQIPSNPDNTTDMSISTKIINSYNQGNIAINGTSTEGLTASGIMYINPKSVTLNNIYNIGTLNNKKTNNIITNNNSNVPTNYKNVYYLNSLTGTKPTDTTNVLGKSESEMKNTTFVSTLNTNKNSINLTEIDSRLSGYTLCGWKLGTSGYPELDCK